MPSEGARANRSGGVGFAHPSQTVSGYLITHREQTLNVASHRFTLKETDRQTRFAEREKKAVHDTTALARRSRRWSAQTAADSIYCRPGVTQRERRQRGAARTHAWRRPLISHTDGALKTVARLCRSLRPHLPLARPSYTSVGSIIPHTLLFQRSVTCLPELLSVAWTPAERKGTHGCL